MYKSVRRVDQTRHAETDAREVIDRETTALAGLGDGFEHHLHKFIGIHARVCDWKLLADHILTFEI